MAFQEEDAAVFFGRDEEVGQGLDLLNRVHRLDERLLVMILGASGTGKSSLLTPASCRSSAATPVGGSLSIPFAPREGPGQRVWCSPQPCIRPSWPRASLGANRRVAAPFDARPAGCGLVARRPRRHRRPLRRATSPKRAFGRPGRTRSRSARRAPRPSRASCLKPFPCRAAESHRKGHEPRRGHRHDAFRLPGAVSKPSRSPRSALRPALGRPDVEGRHRSDHREASGGSGARARFRAGRGARLRRRQRGCSASARVHAP